MPFRLAEREVARFGAEGVILLLPVPRGRLQEGSPRPACRQQKPGFSGHAGVVGEVVLLRPPLLHLGVCRLSREVLLLRENE